MGADEVEVIEQNNIGKVIQLNYVTGTNLLNQVLTNINSITTVVSATDNPVFFTAYKSSSTSVVAQKLRFQFMGGKGTWGAGGKTVLPYHLYQLAPEALLPDDITANSKSNILSLGQISSANDFLNQANGTTRNFSDTSKLHYLSYTQDSVLYLKRFTGQPGEYDGTTTVLTEDDFEEATNSNVQPGLFTPSLKDITNIDPSTDVPITIVDNNSGNETIFTGNQIKHISLDGNITTIDYEQNIDDVSYTIPAKNTDDVFAMQSDINGMTITANQSASELYLKNAEGTVLATINVGFLNNEGTTFFFNEITEKLELKDDLGNVLSTVPVSAFVSNLMQSVNFNGSSPYILEFKDTENNVVDSVSFGINNVEGLQTAIDNKISTSHPANGISGININNWNNVYSASSNYATTNTTQTISGIKTFSPTVNFQSGITLGSGIGSLYDNGRGYFSYTHGLFIQTSIPAYSDTMFELYINGNGYGAQLPVDSIIQGYTYSSTNSIIQTSNLAKGVRFNIDIFHYGGNVCFWFNQPNTFQTFRFKLGVQTNINRTITSITNEIKPTTGITDLITLQPVKTWNSNDFSSTNLSNWNKSVPTDFSIAISTTGYGSSGESLNDIPTGTYMASVSTNATDKPFVSVGAIMSVGGVDSIGGQLLLGRSSNDVWFRPFNTTYGLWYKIWNSGDFTSTNIANWNTAFGWGDYRQFGLGSSSINNINDVNNQSLAAGMYTTSTSSANVAIPGSSGSLLNLRSGVSGGAVGQIWMKSNNAVGEDIYVRHSDSSSIFQPWKRLWHDGDFTSTNIANWNAYAINKADLIGGKIPASQLPSYVDDVLEYANLAAFPTTGETGKLYVAINTNLVYRWSGSGYVVTSSSLALGETSATAYRGDRGKTAYDHSQVSGNPHNTQIADISGLETALSNKANLSETLSHKGTIPSYSELNNYNQTGIYIPHDAETNNNTPSNNKGVLQVVYDTNLTTLQIYHDDYNDFYIRVNVEGGYWRPWERMAKASERILNEDLTSPPTKAILNSLYPTARPTFTVIAPNVEKGNMYVKTNDGWRVFTGNIVY